MPKSAPLLLAQMRCDLSDAVAKLDDNWLEGRGLKYHLFEILRRNIVKPGLGNVRPAGHMWRTYAYQAPHIYP